MVEAYASYWRNIGNFSGTASRKQYWWPVIINWLVGGLLIGIIQQASGHPITDIYTGADVAVNLGSQIVALAVWLATLSVQVRRLHDINFRGWWVLIQFVPLIENIWFFILLITRTKWNRWS